jgi:hypothetical protein
MKRTLAIVALLGLVLSTVLYGCTPPDNQKPATPETNAPPATPTPTNAP